MASSADLTAASGLTYRQVDHWVRQGYLEPEERTKSTSGVPRSWTKSEIEVATRMKKLVDAGFVPEIAVQYARAEPGVIALTPFADLHLLD